MACVVPCARNVTSAGRRLDLLQELRQRLDDAVRDTVLVVVAGGHFHLAHQGERRGVDGHGVGEGAAHVDADADAR